tara:strand:+ start:127 stop:513 length:387 start_codon:yes stop_codon:yes gene_type:complete
MKAKLVIRGHDAHGAGHWGAPRGEREHRGIDYACPVGMLILPIKEGMVTKIGYPYPDSDYRYVQVTEEGYDWRYFYLNPAVELNQYVDTETPIGSVQDLTTRYAGITNHCHLEIKKRGEYINPKELLE